jgi:hypothetical protein
VKPKLCCDHGDRKIGVGKQPAGFEREPVLDGLFGCLAGDCVGGAGECSTGVAQSVGVVGDREVAFEQVAKAGVEVVGVFVSGVGWVAAEPEDQDGEQMPQSFGLGGRCLASGGCDRILLAKRAAGAINGGANSRGVAVGHVAESVVGDRRGLGVGLVVGEGPIPGEVPGAGASEEVELQPGADVDAVQLVGVLVPELAGDDPATAKQVPLDQEKFKELLETGVALAASK